MTLRKKRADELARDMTEQAMATVAEIMGDPFAENRDRLAAAKEALDRGWGKAAQAVIAVPAHRAQRQMYAAMTDDQLMEVIEGEFERLPNIRHEDEDGAIDLPALNFQPDPLLR